MIFCDVVELMKTALLKNWQQLIGLTCILILTLFCVSKINVLFLLNTVLSLFAIISFFVSIQFIDKKLPLFILKTKFDCWVLFPMS